MGKQATNMEGGSMKRFAIFFMALLFFTVSVAGAAEITVNLDWNPNTEPDMAGYMLYKRVEGQAYNYPTPDTIIQCTVTENQCVPTGGSITWQSPDGQLIVYQFVARAFDTEGLESGDSNEVSKTIDLRILPIPTAFVGAWNEAAETVDLTWEQTQSARVVKWLVEYGETEGGPYPDNYYVTNAGQTDYTASVPIIAPPGVITTKYFAIKGFAKYDIESMLSAEIKVDIDKNEPPANVINLHFNVVE